MDKLLKNITSTFSKGNIATLKDASNELKLICLYAYYHYYYGDDDYLYDIDERIEKTPRNDYFGRGYFENDSVEENVLEILIPYYVENEEFSASQVQYRIGQTLNVISQISNGYYGIAGNNIHIKEHWDPKDKEVTLMVKVLTNYEPDFDEANIIRENVARATSIYDMVKSEILFGNDIKNEIEQLTCDAKCVESAEFELDMPNNALFFGKEKSAIVNITANSLKNIYRQYGQAGLFSMNLRFYVPKKNVDEGIEKSIREQGDRFWYLNNGIIIVCDDYELKGNKMVCKNFSIVNGGQTTRMIGVIPFQEDFYISCKVIKNHYQENRDENYRFISAVAEASNTQKPIKPEDVIANKPEQKLLKELLADNGVFMQIKKGDSAVANVKENYPQAWQKTKNTEIGQLLYASVYQRPGTARSSKEKIFSDPKKYDIVFGKRYDVDYIKDLLFLRTYYRDWAKNVKKTGTDATKIGLVNNGMFFFIAAANTMAKFAFSKQLTDALLEKGINSDEGRNIISQKTFNHRLFAEDFAELKTRIYKLFDLICDKYIQKEYLMRKEIQPDLAYSNFLKTDKNFFSIAASIYDDFAYEINPRVVGTINHLFYEETEDDKAETASLVEYAIGHCSSNPDETVDELEDALRNKLKDYRTQKFRERGVKAFVVFTNKELETIVSKKPRNIAELFKFSCFATKSRTKSKLDGEAICEIVKSVYGDR